MCVCGGILYFYIHIKSECVLVSKSVHCIIMNTCTYLYIGSKGNRDCLYMQTCGYTGIPQGSPNLRSKIVATIGQSYLLQNGFGSTRFSRPH